MNSSLIILRNKDTKLLLHNQMFLQIFNILLWDRSAMPQNLFQIFVVL